ncbi:flippase activity-associated protein Agl23 [Haloferula sargassicola]|uniref:TIGR03663 family protein n=1 Tax=Haloferula sargassicola TaxID=490096 RepID=A0ABP9URH6_9BACT
MTRLAACWILVLALAGALRFHDLGQRPLHADEATGARITGRALEGQGYRFDPTHYHGPVLHRLGQLASLAAGHRRWADMEITPLRAVTAGAGLLTVALPLFGVRRYGQPAMLFAALLLATSPMLVYYSRMFIHETLLALFGLLVFAQLSLRRHLWLIGLWAGLMWATKETFVISLAAWAAAAFACWLLLGKNRPHPRELLRRHGRDAALGLAVFLLVSIGFYTDGFRHGRGAWDAVHTYFVYHPTEGHEKPFAWYLQLLGLSETRGGLWWWTGAPLLLAILTAVRSLSPRSPNPATVRFLAIATLLHLLAYSVISYKTPWLMVLPLAHILLLAGLSVAFFPKRPALRVAAGLGLAGVIAWQLVQTVRSSFQFPTEARNRFAYVPTSPDIAGLTPWLEQLDAAQPDLPLQPILVVGSDYWPLPWYLRRYEQVGFYPEPPAEIDRMPLVFATGDLTEQLIATHVPVPRGLRDGLPITVWVRSDFWDASVQKSHD